MPMIKCARRVLGRWLARYKAIICILLLAIAAQPVSVIIISVVHRIEVFAGHGSAAGSGQFSMYPEKDAYYRWSQARVGAVDMVTICSSGAETCGLIVIVPTGSWLGGGGKDETIIRDPEIVSDSGYICSTCSILYEGSRGFPFPSFRYKVVNNTDPGSPVINTDSFVVSLPGVVIPLVPKWYGLIANTMLYCVAIFCLIFGFSFCRSAIWSFAGRCVYCGYHLRNNYSTGCPECGWHRPVRGCGA